MSIPNIKWAATHTPGQYGAPDQPPQDRDFGTGVRDSDKIPRSAEQTVQVDGDDDVGGAAYDRGAL